MSSEISMLVGAFGMAGTASQAGTLSSATQSSAASGNDMGLFGLLVALLELHL